MESGKTVKHDTPNIYISSTFHGFLFAVTFCCQQADDIWGALTWEFEFFAQSFGSLCKICFVINWSQTRLMWGDGQTYSCISLCISMREWDQDFIKQHNPHGAHKMLRLVAMELRLVSRNTWAETGDLLWIQGHIKNTTLIYRIFSLWLPHGWSQKWNALVRF